MLAHCRYVHDEVFRHGITNSAAARTCSWPATGRRRKWRSHGPVHMIAARAPHSRSDPIGTALALSPQSHCRIRQDNQSRDHQKRSSSPIPHLAVLTFRECRVAAVLHLTRNFFALSSEDTELVLEQPGWKCHGISNQGRGCDVEWASCMGPCIDLNHFPTHPRWDTCMLYLVSALTLSCPSFRCGARY